MNDNNIINGDCIEELKKLPDNSIDAIITDPPYGLEFMGKDWDKFKNAENIGGGTMGNRNTPYQRGDKTPPAYYIWTLEQKNEFQIFSMNWATECLRVLKPGGYLLSFGGTRTYHRMTCGIENAGFEIRDCIMWVYGSGFPKSLNIGKSIDKMNGTEYPKNKKISDNNSMSGGNYTRNTINIKDEQAKEWEGWGTALKPAVEPIVVARKPLSEKNVALNVLKWGTGGINIDECRIPFEQTDSIIAKNPHTKSKGTDAYDVNCYGKYNATQEPIDYTNSKGRFPANLILECTCDELKEGKAQGSPGHWVKSKVTGFGEFGNGKSEYFGVGEKDDMKCVVHTDPNCPCYMLDEQSGISNGGTRGNYIHNTKNDLVGFAIAKNRISFNIGDKGGASRFFYCAKASKSERNYGCEELEEKIGGSMEANITETMQLGGASLKGEPKQIQPTKNNHPTVKPVALMEYLIKLVSRENAIVLDPFLGSGTTAIACLKLNRRFIGIEKEPEYIKIAQARIKPYLEQRKLLLEEKQDD